MPIPTASMGFVGSVRFNGGTLGQEIAVRAYSCNISAKQSIEVPDVVDGRIDNTLYQLGPRTVDGDCEFPLVHEGVNLGLTKSCNPEATCANNLANKLWRIASARDQVGRLTNQFNVDVRYTDNTAFRYPNCIINSMRISVTNAEPVRVSFNVIGGANTSDSVREPLSYDRDPTFLSPARIITWNDFRINVFIDEAGIVVPGSYIRKFEVNLNNNADRFYTLNGRLGPQDITARKRTVDGSLSLMGFSAKQFHDFIYNNQQRYTSQSKIAFGYTLGSSVIPYWATALWGVIFEIEQVAISNDIVETMIPFKALGDCENAYEAISLGACDKSVDISPGVSGAAAFGGETSPGYFTPFSS
jgi:hypothetical protein